MGVVAIRIDKLQVEVTRDGTWFLSYERQDCTCNV